MSEKRIQSGDEVRVNGYKGHVVASDGQDRTCLIKLSTGAWTGWVPWSEVERLELAQESTGCRGEWVQLK